MKKTGLNQPLTTEELEFLDDYLLELGGSESDALDADDGIVGMSELDGFLTAVVSAAEMAPTSSWLPLVWGDREYAYAWSSEDEMKQVVSLMLRHLNCITDSLANHPDTFAPIFEPVEFNDEVNIIVDEWCDGYMRGVSVMGEAWLHGGEAIHKLLSPIITFAPGNMIEVLEMADKEGEELQQLVTPAAVAIYQFWLPQRGNHEDAPIARSRTNKVGRNDPCPCGSGKKYKKCCLH